MGLDDVSAPLDALAETPVLLVASDFDGTLAPIVANPADARANVGAVAALLRLSHQPQTHVAIISGRALADLAKFTPRAARIHLVGSHGGEFDDGFTVPLSDAARRLRDRLSHELHRIAADVPGFVLEDKPAGIAFHYRNADESTAAAAVESILRGPATSAGAHIRHGKKVIELSVVAIDKGTALQRLRQRLDPTAVVFLGDDLTDEDAFAVLTDRDAGIKVGPGETGARYRLADPDEAAQWLGQLAERRAAAHLSRER